MHRAFAAAVIGSASLAIFGALFAPEALPLHYLGKPAATLLLLFMVWRSPDRHGMRPGVLIGLLFSLLGDIALMLPVDAFLPGLAAFLLAHLAYIAAFARRARAGSVIWAAFGYGLMAAGLLVWLLPRVPGELRLAVLAYVAVLLAMAAFAAGARFAAGRGLALGGALFVLSDGLLAWDRFHTPLPLAPVWVLSSYWAAQWCIARAVGAGRGDG